MVEDMPAGYDAWKTTPPYEGSEIVCQECMGEGRVEVDTPGEEPTAECSHCEGLGECWDTCKECGKRMEEDDAEHRGDMDREEGR